MVGRAFAAALDSVGVSQTGPERVSMLEYIATTMGQSNRDFFSGLFPDPAHAVAANLAFEATYAQLIDQGEAVALPGAVDAISGLRALGLKICFQTGFSPETRARLLQTLGWSDLADLALSPVDAGRGRPYPDMIFTAVLRLGIDDVRSVVAAGDTQSDIRSGLSAGAGVVAGILTGSHGREALSEAGATLVLESIADLPQALANL
jgi:phosphoglycolate phosphatase